MKTPNYKYQNQLIFEPEIVEQISALLAYWDKNFVCRYANKAYQQWFGVSPTEMIDKITIKELLGPTLFDKNKPYIYEVLQGHSQTFETILTLPDGQIIPTLVSYYPDIQEGEIKGFTVLAVDISSVKKLELELVNSIDNIKSQNNRLLNFSNIVSHNLKSYSNNLQAILELYENASSEEEKSVMFGMLKSISKQFSNTINQLNEISRSQNLAKLKPESVQLWAFIEKTLTILQVQIASNRVTIHNAVSDSMSLTVNPVYLESILLNLITNAIKYRQPNQDPVISLNASFQKDYLVLTVKDNGKGIDLSQHGKNIFGMYKTFHGNIDAQGIGLFLVKNQIESMGGLIEVDSTVDVGTTFTIYFKKSYALL